MEWFLYDRDLRREKINGLIDMNIFGSDSFLSHD